MGVIRPVYDYISTSHIETGWRLVDFVLSRFEERPKLWEDATGNHCSGKDINYDGLLLLERCYATALSIQIYILYWTRSSSHYENNTNANLDY